VFVGVYRIELLVPQSRSLKAKRSVLNGLKTRLAQLNLSVAEVEGQDTWQRIVIGAAAVSGEPGHLDNLAGSIESVCLRDPRAQLLRVVHRVVPFDP